MIPFFKGYADIAHTGSLLPRFGFCAPVDLVPFFVYFTPVIDCRFASRPVVFVLRRVGSARAYKLQKARLRSSLKKTFLCSRRRRQKKRRKLGTQKIKGWKICVMSVALPRIVAPPFSRNVLFFNFLISPLIQGGGLWMQLNEL